MQVGGAPDGIVLQEDAARQRFPTAEQDDPAGGSRGKAPGNVVVLIEYHQTVRRLMGKDVLLGGDVLAHRFVDIQVVGGQIRDHGDIGTSVHGHELEGGQLQHGQILRFHAVHVRQERLADIAAHIHVPSCRL